MKPILFLFVGLSLCSCASLKRSNSYSNSTPIESYLSGRELHDLEESKYELGLQNNRSLTEQEQAQLEKRLYLKQLENNLESSLERNLYFKNKSFFENDNERIAFLSIQDYADKLQWLEQRNFGQRLSKYSNEVEEAIKQNDLILHMSMNAVRESWGEPEEREVSGSELYGNERWTYSHYYSTPDGYKRQERVIYFEHGKVVAWRTL